MKYCNPTVDDLLQQARSITDKDKRIDLYTQFQNALMADLPSLVVDFPQYIAAVNKRVHNYFPNSVYDRFNAETWWIDG